MTLAICTPATDGMQDSATDAPEEAFLDPAVDTPQKRGFDNSVQSLYFSSICRTFRSGGTRIRTGDTMIFSHIQKPLNMRIHRIGKRIFVQGVPLDTTLFCPYCCATVDTSSLTLRGASNGTRRSAGLTRPLVTSPLSYPSVEYVSWCSHKVRCAACMLSLAILAC